MYTEEFAADPDSAYALMRQRHGALVPVDLAPGVPATLVIGYRAALRILHDDDHFRADPRKWQQTAPADSAIMPVVGWRPNALRNTGQEHVRYRVPNLTAIGGTDLYAIHDVVESVAVSLINSFCETGSADLVEHYARPLVFAVLKTALGCPADLAARIVEATATIFEGADAARGNELLNAALAEHVTRKRAAPGDDITSRLISHPNQLGDEEVCHQLAAILEVGLEPLVNLIANTLLLMMTDGRIGGHLLGGGLSTRDALDTTLSNNPPLANFCLSYPRQPQFIEDQWLPADQPIVISMAACNTDPEIRRNAPGNRSHLAWGSGPHACPAHDMASIVARDAIEQLLDALPDLELGVAADHLRWRPGPFHRALVSLPVTFPPCPPLFVPTTPASGAERP
jgi:cytochrome P450